MFDPDAVFYTVSYATVTGVVLVVLVLGVIWASSDHQSLHASEGRHPRGGAASQAASDGRRGRFIAASFNYDALVRYRSYCQCQTDQNNGQQYQSKQTAAFQSFQKAH
jgi:hypothetical protein